jgi:NAD(P)H-hydrate repair Nnr-like enzyme with NAD(P)H-hydrate epimerase domain
MAKEKVLDVKSRVEKVSDEHLNELQQAVNVVNGLQFNIGRLESQKHKALHDLTIGQDKIILLQDKLIKEYGSYDVNLTDGTINWPKDEK